MNYSLRNSVVVRLRVISWIVFVRAGKKLVSDGPLIQMREEDGSDR